MIEQIYYTQCPVGYGLGASNGFQIKRMTPGYPMGGDFRHLGLRAIPAGGRTLAPPSLRYRRDGDVAEVAALHPRAFEYETERGLWGRPGGLFAHGLRLPIADLRAIHHWPAGLWASPAWCRADPEPTRGRPPSPVELDLGALPIPAKFSRVATDLASKVDPDHLAARLAAVATVVRDGRTLFLLGDPDRLAPTVALLTFAFPEAMRPAVTFSTYHDRPEELAGFRIQGTTPTSRPNRPALAGLGIVADLSIGEIEPPIEVPAWARTLADWFTQPTPQAESDWNEVNRRVMASGPTEADWSDAALAHRVGFTSACRSHDVPGSPAEWERLRSFAEWSAATGSGADWIDPRGPAWWRESLRSTGPDPCAELRTALLAHLRIPEGWANPALACEWGEVVGRAYAAAEGDDRETAVLGALKQIPRVGRPAFARALLAELPAGAAASLLRRLSIDRKQDRGMVLPLEAGADAVAVRDGGDAGPLRARVAEARPIPGALVGVLDAVAGVAGPSTARITTFARAVAEAFSPDAPDFGQTGLAWALRRSPAEAVAWAGPGLRPTLSDPDRVADWRALRDRTPEADRPALTHLWLTLAANPGTPDGAFRWGVEHLLLPLTPGDRPDVPGWADTYLRRTPSVADLLARLTTSDFRTLGVRAWLQAARGRGSISPEQCNRLDEADGFIRVVRSRDPRLLAEFRLPAGPAPERGLILQSLWKQLDDARGAGLPIVLDAARVAWPGGFDAGAEGLPALGAALARAIEPFAGEARTWLDRASALADRLRPESAQPGWGWEPFGVIAEMAAATVRRQADPWPLRQLLLRDDRAWPTLAADVRREVERVGPSGVVDLVETWDRTLEKLQPERFFEVVGNSCDGASLARVVAARVDDLRTLPPLAWWDHAFHADSLDDLRDGFARLAPIAPLPEGTLFSLREWLRAGLSPVAALRWRCLNTLSGFYREGTAGSVRADMVRGWTGAEDQHRALASLTEADRHRFVAWVILGLSNFDDILPDPVAKWLVRSGIRDLDRLSRWTDELDGLVEVDDSARLQRVRWIADLRDRLRDELRDLPAGLTSGRRPGSR